MSRQKAAAILLSSIIESNGTDSAKFFEDQFIHRIPIWFKDRNRITHFDEPEPNWIGPPLPEMIENRIKNWRKDPSFDLVDESVIEFCNETELQGLSIYEKSMIDFWKRREDHYRYQYLIQFRKWLHWLSDFCNFDYLLDKDLDFM